MLRPKSNLNLRIMGQKIHPLGLRLGISQPHRSKWCVQKKVYPQLLAEDRCLRQAVFKITTERQTDDHGTVDRGQKPATSPLVTQRVPRVNPALANRRQGTTDDRARHRPSRRLSRPPVKPKPTASVSRLKPRANIQTMFHTSLFQANRSNDVEISDIFIHRRRTLYHCTNASSVALDVVEIFVYTPMPARLIHGTNRKDFIKSVVRFQKSLEAAAMAIRPANGPKLRVLLSVFQTPEPEKQASLIASRLITKLEERKSFRLVLKKTLKEAQDEGIDGIKIQISGRLNGAEIARTEWVRHGSVPLQTLRANLDYSYQTAKTMYGILGVKVWTFKKS